MTDRDRGYEPRWDLDAPYGHQAELLLADVRKGIAEGTVEIKRDGAFHRYGNIYVEQQAFSRRTGRYEPSGINRTQAEWWVFVLGDAPAAIVISTEELRRHVATAEQQGKARECTQGSNPTKGVVIPVQQLLYALKNWRAAA